MPSPAEFLRSHDLLLRKDLGQHFLTDEYVLDCILAAAALKPTDNVLEIGAGIGILTKVLTKSAGHVTSIEIEERMIPLIAEYTGSPPNLTVIRGDALSVPFPREPYVVVANIPYQITSPLLRKLLVDEPIRPSAMTLLVQKEIAERICAKGDLNLLALLIQLHGTPRIARRISPHAFTPQPHVDSALLHIASHAAPLADRPIIDAILHMSRIAFSHKRKMLRGTLGASPEGMRCLEATGIEPTRRPQTLSIPEWIRLAEAWERR